MRNTAATYYYRKATSQTISQKEGSSYARVSTDTKKQAKSYEAQVDYYTNHIQNNPQWEYVNVYAEQDRTGTSTIGREGFNRMVEDALVGRIDLIRSTVFLALRKTQ